MRISDWSSDVCSSDLRRVLCRSGLRLRCERTESRDVDGVLWRVRLVTPQPLTLDGIGGLRVWPITRGDGHARDALEALRLGQPVDLGTMPLVDLTRFLACPLTDVEGGRSLLFR